MNNTTKKNIFFHVGTGKTGTTFLQYRVFPKFKGIYYIQRTRYRKVVKIIRESNFDKYLVSREFDQQLEEEVKKFSAFFPETKPIIVFRRHDSYIASQYRRFVKNGFTGRFTDFFDVENDKGFFKKKDLDYGFQIQILTKYFNPKPIVLIYDDLRKDAPSFIENLARLLDVSVDLQRLKLTKKHTSYTEKQLKAMLLLGKFINMKKRRFFRSNVLHLFWRLYFGFIRYTTLHIAKFIPDKYFDNEALIPEDELEKVRRYYENDWKKCLLIAKE